MEPLNRFAIPSNDLDAVRVDLAEQMQDQAEPRAPQPSDWSGQLPPAFGGGGAHVDADGE